MTEEAPSLSIKLSGYPKQMEFINCPFPESAFIAGVGAGKTYAGAIRSLLFLSQNKGAWGIVTAPQDRLLKIATIPTYERLFPPEFILKKRSSPHTDWELANGGRLFFWSTDKPETIAGAELSFAHMDEGSLSPYQAYINIKKRLRQRNVSGQPYPYKLYITTTPRQLNWLYHEVTKPNPMIHVYNASTLDNHYMSHRNEYVQGLGLTGKQYEQEIEGKFVFLTGDCLFPQEVLERILDDCLPPLRTLEEGYCQIWKDPVVGGNYIAAADCADEGGGGVNDMIIMDAQTGEEVAELNADIAADEFSQRCRRVLSEYGNPLFAPERNGTVGGIVTTKMQDMGYPNLYKDHLGKVGWYTIHKGTATGKIDRFTMLCEYEEAVRRRSTIVRSSEAISEMSTLVRQLDGTYKPREGCKSDRVMARAICWQMRKVKKPSNIGFMSIKRTHSTYN